MSLGRFAAYFCLLMLVCLVAFPQTFGALAPSASAPVIQDLPPGCMITEDDSLTCTPIPPDPMRRRPNATDAFVPPHPRRLEAGGPVLLTPALLQVKPHAGLRDEA